jgi:hypothetical protein
MTPVFDMVSELSILISENENKARELRCIKEFTEMIIESSDPSMFESYERDLTQLMITRGLT